MILAGRWACSFACALVTKRSAAENAFAATALRLGRRLSWSHDRSLCRRLLSGVVGVADHCASGEPSAHPENNTAPTLTGKTLAWRATSLGTLAASCTSARTRGLAAARIGTSGRMRGSSWRLLLSDKSGCSGVAGLDTFIRFLLHLFVGLDLLLARRRRLLSLCRRGDGHANRGRGGEN